MSTTDDIKKIVGDDATIIAYTRPSTKDLEWIVVVYSNDSGVHGACINEDTGTIGYTTQLKKTPRGHAAVTSVLDEISERGRKRELYR